MKAQGARYLQAWHALGTILRDGGSWSGHERNCCFLNTGTNSFADVSSVVGLDHDADARALAVVDWDHDGDLDVWYSHRTAPRVRYMENQTNADNSYLTIQLEGTRVNRDAIGTRLELEMEHQGVISTSVKTLRAGEGFLSQSSKRVHFGLGRGTPKQLRVRWPQGYVQEFQNLQPNTHYALKEQGDLVAAALPSREIALPEADMVRPVATSNLRIIPSRRLPLPELELLDAAGNAFGWTKTKEREFALISLWATWCAPCQEELREFHRAASELDSAGITWSPVNVDDLDAPASETEGLQGLQSRIQKARAILAACGIETSPVLATRSAVECLDVLQRQLVTKQDALPVPSSFLVDTSGQLMAVYKGRLSVAQVLSDVKDLQRDVSDPRDIAIPFPGYWAMNTFPADVMSVVRGLQDVDRFREALDYLVRHVPVQDFPPPITKAEVLETYLKLGRELMKRGDRTAAKRALERAIQVDTTSIAARMALAEMSLVERRFPAAIKQYDAILQLEPRQPMSLNNLAWILATSSDASIRNPGKAVTLAETLCGLSGYREPLSLDTLAVAYASRGDFSKAVSTLEKAVVLAVKGGHSTNKMKARLQLFRAGRPYREP